MEKLQGTVANPFTRSSIEERLIDQELFLMDPEDSSCPTYNLNEGAAVVWYLCDGTRDLDSIAGEIATAFGLQRPDVLPKVKETVTDLQALGLVELNAQERMD